MKNKDFEKEMADKYPYLYADLYDKKSCMYYGICVGAGWNNIIRNASEKIETIILSLSENERHLYKAAQIKAKFGTLRWYQSHHHDQIQEIIGAAEKESASTCEMCGAKAEKRIKNHWMQTRCTSCFEKGTHD